MKSEVNSAERASVGFVPVKRALLSVSDKAGLKDFATGLTALGVELISTGGTAKALADAGLKVADISSVTGFPEMMDGRVKTLHPKIHGGLLAVRDDPAHAASMKEHGIGAIDLVVVNLYPFEATIASGARYDLAIENIDIGGPSMVRSAAKNHRHVAIVTDTKDYQLILDELHRNKGALSYQTRQQLALKAYALTAQYDAAIANWMHKQVHPGEVFPETALITAKRKDILRYGENPHQQAAIYQQGAWGLSQARQLQGKELSYNNFNDAAAALNLVMEFLDPAVVIVKHANPCGVALAHDIVTAYEKALAADPVSAFGGIVAMNRPLDGPIAHLLVKKFLEVIIAPTITPEAQNILSAKTDLRVITTGDFQAAKGDEWVIKSLQGGLLIQTADVKGSNPQEWKVVTQKQPTAQQLKDMAFAFSVVKHVKSNAIVFAKDSATIGIGAGQMNRVGSAKIAIEHGGANIKGCVVASDAFLPFPDTLEVAAAAGAVALVQPGGSKKDDDVIKRADELGVAMVFTGVRHFLH